MAQIQLRSAEQILGDLVRIILANTDLTDLAPGSDLATLLEGIASSEFQIQVSALKILENSNLESLVGVALDRKAESIRLPNGVGGYGRKPASQTIGPITIGSGFSKISTKLYAGKPAPYSGSDTLYVENGSTFKYASDGTILSAPQKLYIGRGTIDRFEGPIDYDPNLVQDNGTYWTISLATSLTKSHLHSDLIVFAQGGDRVIPAGVIVQVPLNNESVQVTFTTLTDLTIADGEDSGTVNVACTQFGEMGNALAGSITQFSSLPFAGATVTNATSFRSGKSAENDEDLRQRIKAYPSTLSRGTKDAILAAILGATDPESGRTVQSASILDPVEPGDNARVFIDDGTGLEPSFGGQAYEMLLQNALGQETRFRTAQFPVTPATVEGANRGPFVVSSGMSLVVQVDEIVETYSITVADYVNLNAATAYEIVRDLNSQSNIVGFRTIDDGRRIVATDLSGEGEKLTIYSGDLQEVLGFPLATVQPIFLYKNSELQSFRGKTATLETNSFNGWSISVADVTGVRVNVDGVIQTISIVDADFTEFSTTVSSATLTQWSTVLSRKIAGVKFTVSGQVLVWSTYQTFSDSSYLEILETHSDGTPATWIGTDKMWKPASAGGILSDSGAVKSFYFNRFSGEINLAEKPEVGDIIEIGSRTTRAHVLSKKATSGLFSVEPIPSTVGEARLIAAFDGDFVIRSVSIPTGTTIVPTEPDTHIVRLTLSSPNPMYNAQLGDWLYLTQDNAAIAPISDTLNGFYRIKAKGANRSSSTASYSGLSAQNHYATSVLAQSFTGSSIVRVDWTNHGLQTGDLITVVATGTLGGLTIGQLSVTNAPIIVLSANLFTYVASATATSDDLDNVLNVGTNVLTVTHTGHGFIDGAVMSFAGLTIGGVNPAATNTELDINTVNTYSYRATTAATSLASGSVSATYAPDCWVEFEVSAEQYTAGWSAALGNTYDITQYMVHLFYSSVIPQIVYFGLSVSTLDIDQVVDLINEQIVSGSAYKISPTQLALRSNDFVGGTCAVLATIGNALNVFETAISSSLQPHVANVISKHIQGGTPEIQEVVVATAPALGYATRTYLKVGNVLTDVYSSVDPLIPDIECPTIVVDYPKGFQHLWMTGRFAGLSGRVYNNQIAAPFLGIMRGDSVIKPFGSVDTVQGVGTDLDRYMNFGLRFRDLSFNENDRLVIEMDLNAADKTVSIPFYKYAKIYSIDSIAGSGAGQVISFELCDPEDSDKRFFDVTSIYKDFDFRDFRFLCKNVGLYRESLVVDRALVLRSVAYGAPNRLRFSIRLSEQPDIADLVLNHYHGFSTSGEVWQTLVATLPSDSLIVGSLINNGLYWLKVTASSTLFDWRISHPYMNAGNEFIAGNVLNIRSPEIGGSYEIISASYNNYVNPTAYVDLGSSIVRLVLVGHTFQIGDLIAVLASASIGGITATQLSTTSSPVVNVVGNEVHYTSGGTATVSTTGTVALAVGGVVTVKSPGSAGISAELRDSANEPIQSWELIDKTWSDLATAINAYYPDSPIATAEAIGTNIGTNPIAHPTYVTYPNAVAYSGTDMAGAFDLHSFNCKLSANAGIWQYDNSAVNGIKATVQSDDSIFPTITEASGTTYSPIGEEVILVPTNTKTVTDWLAFKATSALHLLADIERINSDAEIQISSKSDGSAGAVSVTGVSATELASSVLGVSSSLGDATKLEILNADAKSIVRGSLVRLENTLNTEIARAYRDETDTANYFRPENAIRYVRLTTNTARILFLRDDTEPFAIGDDIVLTNLGSGLVQVSCATKTIPARVGEMAYFQPNSPFAYDIRCEAVQASGFTEETEPEYLGYPVVHIVNNNTIIIIAPNITTFGTTTLTSATDLVFVPAIWNEKNIRTNHQEGAKFKNLINNNKFYYLVNVLGNGLVSVVVQNSATEATDTMLLDVMSVGEDDFAIFGEGFDPANQGTCRVVAHNGRNQFIVYNPTGGKDELIGDKNDLIWRVGPVEDGINRALRILSTDSVRIGDYLRISTPDSDTQWFNDVFFGSWVVVGIGYAAWDFTGSPPWDIGVGSYDQSKFAPYVDIQFPNAPDSIVDDLGAPVDKFDIGANSSSLGFVESSPYVAHRMVAGYGASAQNAENAEVFLVPKLSGSKFASTFGTVMTVLGKLGYPDGTYQGIDGYKIFTGLVQQVHRIIDGLPQNTVLYPGVRAAGAVVEVQTPLIKSMSISLNIRPKDGVTINSISDLVKSTVASYINGLGVGRPVVLSEIIRVVQSLPGVYSVKIASTTPTATDDIIIVSEIEKAYVLDSIEDIVVGVG